MSWLTGYQTIEAEIAEGQGLVTVVEVSRTLITITEWRAGTKDPLRETTVSIKRLLADSTRR